MATYIPVTNMPYQLLDADGNPAVGGKLEFYLDGTDTATELFTNEGVSIGNEITLNAWGMPESGGNTITLFRDASKAIKIVGLTAGGATIYTSDGIPAQASFDATASAKLDAIEEEADKTDAENVAAAGAVMEDGSGEMTGDLAFASGAYLKHSTTSGIVASTTQTQAGGTALIAALNEVGTVANANDTVVLPAIVVGRQVIVINNGANTMQIFPPVGGQINAAGTDTAVTLASGSNAIYCAWDATNYEAV